MPRRYYYLDKEKDLMRPAAFFTTDKYGFKIHFGADVQPTLAFSRDALEAEIKSLVAEADFAVFTEVEFKKAQNLGLIVEELMGEIV